jgi:hypothetical protein
MEITHEEVFEYVYNNLIKRGLAPYKDDVDEIVDVFFDLMEDLGIGESE